ncbi:DUF4476 domain-containing protein [Arachidicoccus soli]|uniref:DUF4476 domain-containing protein n=2 Tax=Arachidicoccus soli TaxID=2341117 RepID=A0A386HLW2_9BACT|nr:DUF4476 domain-containing protein [Arachidicoccus soli]
MQLFLLRNFIQMNHSVLKKIGLVFLIICLIGNLSVFAQDKDNNHFIYIQAKSKQPFYVILNRKVFSSSSIGYLIIPKLQDGTYNLRIGFPKQDAPEQNYSCVISGSDMGYSLQKNDNGDLGLLNLQTKSFIASKGSTSLEDQYAVNTPKKAAVNDKEHIPKNEESANNVPSNNAFGQMLSGAINDPTLNKKVTNTPPPADLSKQEEQNTTHEVAAVVNNQDQTNSTQESPRTNLNSADLLDDSQTYGVIKSNEKVIDNGTKMTFVLFNSHSTDTITILVPSPSDMPQEKEVVTSGITAHSNEPSNNNSLALFSNSSGMATDGEDIPVKRRKKKFVDMGSNQSDDRANAASGKTVDNPFFNKSADASNNDGAGATDAVAVDNSTLTANCDNPLSGKDFNKMQKKMVAKSNDDQMIAIVDKYINGKCVTTQQVKQLGGLFLSDAGRFALYQDAYSHVADKENYGTLQSQLLDTYFKNRFLKMLK